MLKQIVFTAMLFLAIGGSLCGQELTNAEIREASVKIREERPAITVAVLNRDTVKIKSSFNVISEKYKVLGFSEDETGEAVLSGWQQVRLESPLKDFQSINENSFVDFMTVEFLANNGKVWFTSTPDAAELTVNNENLGVTKKAKWYAVGETLSVTCKKEGFETIQTTCSVQSGRNDCPCNMTAIP